MQKIFKWIGVVLGVVVGLVVVAVAVLVLRSNRQLNKTYDVRAAEIAIHNDAETLSRGAYIYASSCSGCHGANLAGSVLMDDPAIGYIPASNLTSGKGGIGQSYSDYDYVLALRHGIRPDGKSLMIMPSKVFWYMNDTDLAAVIAYLKSVPAVDNELGEKQIKFMGKVLNGIGAFGEIFPAEVIDHEGSRPSAPQAGMTVEYGEYLANSHGCWDCHGKDYAGAQAGEPGAPFSSNLTPNGPLGSWSTDEFINTLRTGTTPDGRQLDGEYMPYKEIGLMTDEDLAALFMLLQSLPAAKDN